MDRIERGGRRDVKMQTTFSWSLSKEQSQQRSGPVRRFLNAYNYPGTKHVRP
jgi:hypothetical protein